MGCSCKKFIRGFGFTILTLITIGSTIALFAACLYFIKTKLDDISQTLLIVVIVALCISILVFIFGIYASVKGKKCARSLLAIIYIFYALIVGAMAIFVLACKGVLYDAVKSQFDSGNQDFINIIQAGFNCKSWDNATVGNTSCKSAIETFYNSTILIIGICLGVVFFILLVGIIFVFKYVCCGKDDKSDDNNQISTPLTYGW
ncbi:Tetraspanin family protein [Histomonas meleagridis]|uniref:Tetraspanin family protein n=1 Tax=Histomonas meleagridis TaxID=135588 RepID=UPI00355A87D3|nr:Tetraspanin family protein [Histomonas meleagridis]KAH0803039.1 Tetraspanin family protein [Histomonas meleagridis]